ncbi:acyl-CoA dehydrogenase family protein [Komagataeibacter oboediens]|uniref:acyl-CoA dehydrogenase family protein n=1 Tax=Komagataeibacter oboediens TaxID=65958 RepID=UPI0019059DCB|nr:acyl-CoA dehydrogenase family protein [Komagataeibacter oboediens]GCE78919.1 acyl-CoA dehydrogenase [Komagataeibacter oboediens]
MTFPFEALAACRAELEAEASAGDAQATFPTAGLQRLRQLGVLAAALPRVHGGLGLGTEPHGAAGLLHMLRLVGQGSMALGRVVEGHVNAIRLVCLYGTSAQVARIAQDVHDDALYGLWVTDGATPLRMEQAAGGLMLHGGKAFASAARQATHALVTARAERDATRMLLVALDEGRTVQAGGAGLAGMRGAGTGQCDLTGMAVLPAAMVGQPGDYLRQPEFSAGAWRGMAVALGGIERLSALLRSQLATRGRAAAPAQQARIGRALIAAETALLWTRRAARMASGQDQVDAGDIAATVNLGRLAVERAGLEVIELVERGLGLSAFVRGNVVERLVRDLATYLRQPAPDETLCEAAAWFTHRDLPQPDVRP